jgi:hypothetical protein
LVHIGAASRANRALRARLEGFDRGLMENALAVEILKKSGLPWRAGKIRRMNPGCF